MSDQQPTVDDYQTRFLALLKNAGTDGDCRKCGARVRWLANKGRGAARGEHEPSAWTIDCADHVRSCTPPPRSGNLEDPLHFWRAAIVAALSSCGDSGRCFGCNTRVWWIVHANGKKTPYTEHGLNHFIDCPQRDRFRKKP
jgi:hypothetical protein